jgi:lysophospholipid acyltransferase (LPLAT)-like uncharacterized protein
MRFGKNLSRRIRFLILEKIVLPIAIAPLKGLIWSWRRRGPDAEVWREFEHEPRVILATYHGMFLDLLGYAHLAPEIGKRLLVMLTPSLDGRLLGAAIAHFEIDHVLATYGQRGVAGAREFSARVADGALGLIAVDGPRGPAGDVRPEVLQLARAANAKIYLVVTSGHPSLGFNSWDRAHLPLPFSVTDLCLKRFVPLEGADDVNRVELQTAMHEAARKLGSPIFRNRADRRG